MLNVDDIFQVYRLRHGPDGEVQRQLAGRFAFLDGEVAVLEDHFGLLQGLDGPVDERRQRLIDSLSRSAYTDVVRAGDLKDGSRPDLLPRVQLAGGASGDASQVGSPSQAIAQTPPAVWDYHRPGMETPQCLEWHRGTQRAMLNGQSLTDDELQQLLQNLDDGTATLRYRGTSSLPGVAKMESALVDLRKAEGEKDLYGVMEKLKAMSGAGQLHPDELQLLHQGLYGDQMVPEVGNKRAYKDFLTRQRPGVHVMLDANRFKSINDQLGHEAGDKAITALGTAMRQAMDETVGRQHGKLFRWGGDEFAAHMPTYEHAAQFGRALRAKLEAIPALGGTHRLSVSMGIGHTPEAADQALTVHAKDAAHAAGPQMEALHAHSLVPGHEGPIPTGAKPLNIAAPSATVQRPHEEAGHVSTAPVGNSAKV